MGKIYSALADWEDKTGNHAAVRFHETSLGNKHQAGQPEDTEPDGRQR